MSWQKGIPAETGMYYVRLISYEWCNRELPPAKYKEIVTMSFYKGLGWYGDLEYTAKISKRIINWHPVEYFLPGEQFQEMLRSLDSILDERKKADED